MFRTKFFSHFFFSDFFRFFFKICPILPKIFDLVLDEIFKRWSLELDHIVDLRLVYQYLFKAKVICSLTSDSIILVLDKDKIIMQWKNHNTTWHITSVQVREQRTTDSDGEQSGIQLNVFKDNEMSKWSISTDFTGL